MALSSHSQSFYPIPSTRQKYKDSDVEVVRKDGILLLREMAAEVKNFMDFKMNAVMVSSCTAHCTVEDAIEYCQPPRRLPLSLHHLSRVIAILIAMKWSHPRVRVNFFATVGWVASRQ